MKKNIHPTYNIKAVTKCACGQTFQIPSTQEEMEVDICSNCHPFYTGKAKVIDAANRIAKFQSKVAKTKTLAKSSTDKKAKQTKRAQAKADKDEKEAEK